MSGFLLTLYTFKTIYFTLSESFTKRSIKASSFKANANKRIADAKHNAVSKIASNKTVRVSIVVCF